MSDAGAQGGEEVGGGVSGGEGGGVSGGEGSLDSSQGKEGSTGEQVGGSQDIGDQNQDIERLIRDKDTSGRDRNSEIDSENREPDAVQQKLGEEDTGHGGTGKQDQPKQDRNMKEEQEENPGLREQDKGVYGDQDTKERRQNVGSQDSSDQDDTQGLQDTDQDQTGYEEDMSGKQEMADNEDTSRKSVCTAEDPDDCDSPNPFPNVEDEPSFEDYVEGEDLIYSIDPYDKARGYKLLESAAHEGNSRAMETLAYSYIFGSYLSRNFTRAFEIFTKLADKGSPVGQMGLGFMYSTGIGMNSNQAKAVVNYVFAALGGHQLAQMAMGYRAHMGVGVVQSCEGSLAYYQKSADEVVDKASMACADITVSKVRLMDEDDEPPSIYGVSEDEMLHYQNLFTDSGNTRAQFTLGIYYMMGLAGARRSSEMALKFLQQAADNHFPAAYVLMGKIYAEGSDDLEPDYELAYKYFKAAANLKYGDGLSGLGWLYSNGLGVTTDKRKAIELFQKAADKGSPEGHYYLGRMYYYGDGVRRDVGKAVKYLQLASHGDHLYALHLLGMLNTDGSGVKRSCSFAVDLFKSVSERGTFTRMFSEARRLYTIGDVDSSFLMYSFLAELGFEEAQSNVAYLLEQGDLTFLDDEVEQMKRALLFWNRAAAQGYHQARVKLGDYYYYGLGTEVSYEAAATQYRMASDKLGTPQAMFNLGYMYEHGEGLEKDYHLAKRYYDLAAETSNEAVIPANMALLKLNLMYTFNHYKEWFDFQEVLSGKWDIYLITVLSGLVVLLIIWRRRH